MRFLVFGVGAIGTYIGASLAMHQSDVVFIERPGFAALNLLPRLKIFKQNQEYSLENPVIVDNLTAALNLGPFDACILAIKSYDTLSLLDQIKEYRQHLPPILCLQNGVENEERIAGILGTEKVIRGTVTSAIGRRGLGDVTLEKMRGVGIADEHPVSPGLVSTFNDAGLGAVLYPDGLAMKWSKLLTNLPANATSAILDWTASRIYKHPGIYHLEISMLREALNVMSAQNIPVVNLPGTPVKFLSALVRMPERLSQPLLYLGLAKGRGGKMPSFHIDLHSGSGRSEVDYLNGAVVRFGSKLRIDTDCNRKLTEILLAITHGQVGGTEYTDKPERLIQKMSR